MTVVVDLSGIIEDVGEEAMAMEILSAYLDELAERIPALKQAILDSDYDLAQRQAHSIKGGALNFNVHELARPALELENMAKSQDIKNADSLVASIEKGYADIKDFYERKLGG